MRLDFDDEQLDLAAAADAVLDRECAPAFVRAVFEGEASWQPLYETMSALGWQALAVPESRGGLGLGFVEVGIVVEALGRHVAPGPYVTTATQFLPALLGSGVAGTDDLVAGVLAGAVTGTLVDGGVSAERSGGTVRLTGTVAHVLGAGDVTHLAVVAGSATTLAVVPVDGDGVEIVA
ncbi:MAG: acyl-CoA dehydrogenase family protein, partial [Acidimicrobiia bacterium]|nr:acyl-CoA dehydrogenase family protein [Acidimicrobiia bacterium]